MKERTEAPRAQRATIQVRPTVTWPTFTDADNDVEDFLETLDELTGLANDGAGMGDKERLRVLGSCLKQSRAKFHEVRHS